MEQVFHEMGIGSVTQLHEFYQTRVLKYHEHMQETCQQLLDDYEKAKNPELKMTEEKQIRWEEMRHALPPPLRKFFFRE